MKTKEREKVIKVGRKRTNAANKKREENCRFYLVNPKEGTDANEIAKKLLNFNGVKEVYITEGAHGFVVKADDAEGVSANFSSFLKNIDNKFDIAVSCFKYMK